VPRPPSAIAALFVETHEDPTWPPSDGPNMVKLADMPALIEQVMRSTRLAKAA